MYTGSKFNELLICISIFLFSNPLYFIKSLIGIFPFLLSFLERPISVQVPNQLNLSMSDEKIYKDANFSRWLAWLGNGTMPYINKRGRGLNHPPHRSNIYANHSIGHKILYKIIFKTF